MRIAKDVLHSTSQEAKQRMSVVEARRWIAFLMLENEAEQDAVDKAKGRR